MTNTFVQFFVPGIARPKGSMRSFMHGGTPVLTSDNPKLKGWAKAVHYTAVNEANRQLWGAPYGGPVEMVLAFVLPAPKRPKDVQHITKPDLDKLVRGVFDALTGVLFVDDARVVKVMMSKEYETHASPAGVHISATKARD